MNIKQIAQKLRSNTGDLFFLIFAVDDLGLAFSVLLRTLTHNWIWTSNLRCSKYRRTNQIVPYVLVEMKGIEPSASRMQSARSTPELHPLDRSLEFFPHWLLRQIKSSLSFLVGWSGCWCSIHWATPTMIISLRSARGVRVLVYCHSAKLFHHCGGWIRTNDLQLFLGKFNCCRRPLHMPGFEPANLSALVLIRPTA